MSMYATVDFYRNEYGGGFKGSDDELSRLLNISSVKIDAMTFGRIGGGFSGLTGFQQEKISLACCCQADYYDKNGGGMAGVKSYKLPDVSVTMDTGGGKTPWHAAGMSEAAFALVELTGLSARGI